MKTDYLERALIMIDKKKKKIEKLWELEKCPFHSELEKYEGEGTLTGYNIKDSRNIIKVSDPFFQEILKIRSEANYWRR